TWQHGFPITITAADLGGLNDTFGTNRANLVGDPKVDQRTVTRWFNTSAFAQPDQGVLGNLGRNTERGPGINNLDLALFKNFEFARQIRVQFRLESFNALNHTQFDGVSTNLANRNFGVVTSARPARFNQLGLNLLFGAPRSPRVPSRLPAHRRHSTSSIVCGDTCTERFSSSRSCWVPLLARNPR